MKTDVFTGTWLGRPGTSRTHRLQSRNTGLRVIEHQWADEPTVTVRVVIGDGRYPSTFAEYLKVEDVEPGQGLALAHSLA